MAEKSLFVLNPCHPAFIGAGYFPASSANTRRLLRRLTFSFLDERRDYRRTVIFTARTEASPRATRK
jgi:hypothetical protein